jgi:hypothetical protein
VLAKLAAPSMAIRHLIKDTFYGPAPASTSMSFMFVISARLF